MNILVTGAKGSVGSALVPALKDHSVYATDIETLDVTEPVKESLSPDVIYHMAAFKHAPAGEEDPYEAAHVNILGTANMIDFAADVGAKMIMASTCKACDPETAYGATKLIAERMVLNAGGVVVRYYNIREASGNVFRIWEKIPESEPIPWTDCYRYFIGMRDVTQFNLAALDLPSGRYTVNPGSICHMSEVAKSFYPNRVRVEIAPRRGDRAREPRHAVSERLESNGWIEKIVSPHD